MKNSLYDYEFSLYVFSDVVSEEFDFGKEGIKIGIGDLSVIIKAFNIFNDREITLKVDKSVFELSSGGGSIKHRLQSIDTISNHVDDYN